MTIKRYLLIGLCVTLAIRYFSVPTDIPTYLVSIIAWPLSLFIAIWMSLLEFKF